MGDRTTVYLTLSGNMTRAAFTKVKAAMDDEMLRSMEDDEPVGEGSLDHTFYAHDVNYAMLGEVENVCDDEKIAFEYWWDAGGGYGAGIKRFFGEGEIHESSCGGDALPSIPLSRLLEVENLAQGWAGLLKEARFWCTPMEEPKIVD